MITVFHAPGSRSVRVLWLCFELDLRIRIETVELKSANQQPAEFLTASPAGKIPAIIDHTSDGDVTLFESGAINEHLLDRYANGQLRPPIGSIDRAKYLQWCWFAEATLLRPLGLYRVLRAGRGDDTVEAVQADALAKARAALHAVEQAVSGNPYVAGSEFSAADIMLGYSLNLIEPIIGEDFPAATRYLDGLKSRAAFQQALAS